VSWELQKRTAEDHFDLLSNHASERQRMLRQLASRTALTRYPAFVLPLNAQTRVTQYIDRTLATDAPAAPAPSNASETKEQSISEQVKEAHDKSLTPRKEAWLYLCASGWAAPSS
jgi:hypothetical protein